MGQTRNKPSISQRIANLPFIETVDVMLLEGTTARDVAKFVQEDQGALTDVPFKTLSNALAERKRSKRREYDIGDEDDGDGEEGDDHWINMVRSTSPKRQPKTPSTLARAAYERTKGGIDELVELEAMYLTQRDRIDRLVELEAQNGAFGDKTGAEIAVAIDALLKRAKVKEMMGLIGQGADDRPDITDFEGFSEETARVLQDPESRHRVIDIVQRIRRMTEKSQEADNNQKLDAASGE